MVYKLLSRIFYNNYVIICWAGIRNSYIYNMYMKILDLLWALPFMGMTFINKNIPNENMNALKNIFKLIKYYSFI